MLLSGTAGEAAAAPACPLFQERQPNDPRPAVMPTGLAVGLEPPRAPGAAGTVCPKTVLQAKRPGKTVGIGSPAAPDHTARALG